MFIVQLVRFSKPSGKLQRWMFVKIVNTVADLGGIKRWLSPFLLIFFHSFSYVILTKNLQIMPHNPLFADDPRVTSFSFSVPAMHLLQRICYNTSFILMNHFKKNQYLPLYIITYYVFYFPKNVKKMRFMTTLS